MQLINEVGKRVNFRWPDHLLALSNSFSVTKRVKPMTTPAITTVTNDTIPTASQTVFEENAVTRNVNAATDNVIMAINLPIDIIANDACSSSFFPAQLDRARIAMLDTANKAVTIPTAIAISYNDEILDKIVNATTEPVNASIK